MTSTNLVDISVHLQPLPPHFIAIAQDCAQCGRRIRKGPFVCRRYQVSVCPFADHRPRPPMHCPFVERRKAKFWKLRSVRIGGHDKFRRSHCVGGHSADAEDAHTNEERPLTLVIRPRSFSRSEYITQRTNASKRAAR